MLFFRWREIRLIRELDELQQTRDILENHGIPYHVLTNTMTNPGRYHGVPNVNADSAYEYRVLVPKRYYPVAKQFF